jgi:hypothetical protein
MQNTDIIVLATHNYGIYENVNLQQLQLCTGVMRCKINVQRTLIISPSSVGPLCMLPTPLQMLLLAFSIAK